MNEPRCSCRRAAHQRWRGYLAPPRGRSRGHAHNEYFEALAGRGALGLLALLMLYFVPGVVFLRKALTTEGKEKALATAGVTFIAGFMVYGISEVPLQGNVISGCYALTVVAIYAMLKRPEAALV